MNELALHLADYLALRRALGFKLEREGHELPGLVAYLEAAGAATLSADLAIAWAGLPQHVQPIRWAHRLGSIVFRYLATIDPATEVPSRDVFGAREQRPAPYLWSEAAVCRLLEAACAIRPSVGATSP